MYKINANTRVLLKVLTVILAFYIFIFVLWNVSNKDHKPSNALYDWRKEGYQHNPLHDRKSPNFLDPERVEDR